MKQIFIFSIFLTFIMAFFCGCAPNGELKENDINGEYEAQSFEYSCQYLGDIERKLYTYNGYYSDTFFDNSSFVYSQDLAKLACCYALSSKNYVVGGDYTTGPNLLKNAFQATHFSNIYVNQDYLMQPTAQSLGIGIASKQIANKNVVVCAIRSGYYEKEWANNMLLGYSGDHNGFKDCALRVFSELKNYILSNNFILQNTKVLICGFSRGGSVANLLGGYIDSNKLSIALPKENIFVYTFFAPHPAVAVNDDVNYGNIHNIYNSHDFLSNLINNAFGFVRFGKDYDVYNANAIQALANYDEDFSADNFAEKTISVGLKGITIKDKTNATNDVVAWYRKMISYITVSPANAESISVHTRQEFCENLQGILVNFFDYYYSLSGFELNIFIESLKENGKASMILGLLSNEPNAIYDFVISTINGAKGIYNSLHIEYRENLFDFDEQELIDSCNKIQGIIYNCLQAYDFEFLSSLATLYANLHFITFNHIAQMANVLVNELGLNNE